MEDKQLLDHYDPKLERIEDYKERFDFYCVAHEVAEYWQKALFPTRVGQVTYAKLKTLVSPQPLTELSLDTIVAKLADHYHPETIEVAERYKFFKHLQDEAERVAEYAAELRRLAKTCNFGSYSNMALRDQLVCWLQDHQIRRELLCMRGLELTSALDKARAMEAVTKEAHIFARMEETRSWAVQPHV